MNVAIMMIVWFLGQSAAVSWLTSALKGFPIVARNVKLVAGALSLIASWVVTALFIPPELQSALVGFLQAVAAALGSSGVYEWVTKPAKKALRPRPMAGSGGRPGMPQR
jgi:hypothetical protein